MVGGVGCAWLTSVASTRSISSRPWRAMSIEAVGVVDVLGGAADQLLVMGLEALGGAVGLEGVDAEADQQLLAHVDRGGEDLAVDVLHARR